MSADVASLSMFTGKGKRFMPPEIFELVLDSLDGLSTLSLMDYVHLITALTNSCLQRKLGERLQLVNLTGKIQPELLQGACTGVLASYSNIVDLADVVPNRRIVYLVDESTSLQQLTEFRPGGVFDVLYCGDSSHVSTFVQLLAEKIFLDPVCAETHHIVFDLPDETLYTGAQLFGILDLSTLQKMLHFNGKLLFTFPQLRTLRMDYLAFDSWVYKIFNCKTSETVELLALFLDKVHWNMPELDAITFVRKFSDVEEESCNFIDLSSLMLRKFQEKRIKLCTIFQIHSFANWNLPRIRRFTGHRFKFDETSMTGSPERTTVSLRQNISYLREMAINETKDATPYYRLDLIPQGVTSTKILNWIPMIKVPLFILKSKTLESLELKLLDFNQENTATTMIQGLYLPKLTFLQLQQQLQTQDSASRPLTLSNRRGSIIMTTREEHTHVPETEDSWPDAHPIVPVTFSSWNELCNCETVDVLMSDNSSRPQENRFLFNIRNLRRILPSCNLRQSFKTYVDDRQQLVIV